jgi:hypothetical protein
MALFSRFLGHNAGRGTRPKSHAAKPLVLEALEGREVPSTCVVNSHGDTGVGVAADHGDLRFCLTRADTLPGPDTIVFSVTGTIALNGALPPITDDLSIAGPGADLLTVDAQGKGRIFSVVPGVSADISGLALIHAVASGDDAKGTAVYNQGDLVLRDCSVAKNNSYPASSGTLTGPGGAIYNGGTMQLLNCSVSENRTHGFFVGAGGVYNTGSLLIDGSVISNNSGSTDTYWAGTVSGGGIFNKGGEARIFNSIVFGNAGHAGLATRGGGINNEDGVLLVQSSLIANNLSHADDARGGGISSSGGSATLLNSTIANNTATAEPSFTGNPIDADGGGIYVVSGSSVSLTVRNCTIAQNAAVNAPETFAGGVDGGYFVAMHNTIVAKNTSGKFADVLMGLVSSGYNLVGDSSGGSGSVPPTCWTSIRNSAPSRTTAARAGRWPFCPAARPSTQATT